MIEQRILALWVDDYEKSFPDYIDGYEIPIPEVVINIEPVKQNGRSAAYLKHDKSKIKPRGRR